MDEKKVMLSGIKPSGDLTLSRNALNTTADGFGMGFKDGKAGLYRGGMTMQYCVYLTVLQYGSVHVEAESEDEAKREAEKLYEQHQIDWYDDEITDLSPEEVSP